MPGRCGSTTRSNSLPRLKYERTVWHTYSVTMCWKWGNVKAKTIITRGLLSSTEHCRKSRCVQSDQGHFRNITFGLYSDTMQTTYSKFLRSLQQNGISVTSCKTLSINAIKQFRTVIFLHLLGNHVTYLMQSITMWLSLPHIGCYGNKH